mmetsp:Transcript_15061/g.26704  ORF Transcript_15061/g.26704 Transcript_15061/m.26704 type:complete len:217 (+) Transcript_15061:584-1234(+)
MKAAAAACSISSIVAAIIVVIRVMVATIQIEHVLVGFPSVPISISPMHTNTIGKGRRSMRYIRMTGTATAATRCAVDWVAISTAMIAMISVISNITTKVTWRRSIFKGRVFIGSVALIVINTLAFFESLITVINSSSAIDVNSIAFIIVVVRIVIATNIHIHVGIRIHVGTRTHVCVGLHTTSTNSALNTDRTFSIPFPSCLQGIHNRATPFQTRS